MTGSPGGTGRSDRGTRLPALGPRGEGWVVLQFALFAALAGGGFVGEWPAGARRWLLVAGVLLVVAGGAVAIAAGARLGRSLTPLPRPRGTALRDTGLYARARHPIYGGVLLVALGWSLARTPWALVPAAALWLLLRLKSEREELWLAEHYPGYAAYRTRVSRRFLG